MKNLSSPVQLELNPDHEARGLPWRARGRGGPARCHFLGTKELVSCFVMFCVQFVYVVA